jgi:cell division protein DivIC
MKKAFRILTNKFLVTGAAFAVWMVFFDQNNWTAQETRKKELRQTENGIAYLNQQIAVMEKEHYELVNNPERLEQYARERYKMKKDNEDIYIVGK